jgi:hypothetical protein
VVTYSYFSDQPVSINTVAPREVSSPNIWLPRWFSTWDTKTVYSTPVEGNATGNLNYLDAIYRAAIANSTKDVKKTLDLYKPTFYSSTSSARLAYRAEQPKNNFTLSLSSISSGHVSGVLEYKENLNSLVNLNWKPCYTTDNGSLIFRNLSLYEATITVDSSGFLNLNLLQNYNNKVIDSPIYISNIYGDISVIEPEVAISYNGLISLNRLGTYKVRYEIENFVTAICSGTYLKVDTTNTPAVYKFDLINPIDEVAQYLGLKRLVNEDNLALRSRCQNYSLSDSNSPSQALSSILGMASPIIWDTSTTLTLSLSGNTGNNFPGLDEEVRVLEKPYKDGSLIKISRTPNGLINLYLDDKLVDFNSFSLSGQILLFKDTSLNNIDVSRFTTTYRTNYYTTTNTSSGLSLLPSVEQKLEPGIISTGVQIENLTNTKFEFRWGKKVNISTGLFTF